MNLAMNTAFRTAQLRLPMSRTRLMTNGTRWNSTSSGTPQSGEKQVSPHIGFYKTFTRPVAKVLLLAVFTYQLAYWGWVKLEKDEIKSQKNAEILVLEKELEDLKKKGKTP